MLEGYRDVNPQCETACAPSTFWNSERTPFSDLPETCCSVAALVHIYRFETQGDENVSLLSIPYVQNQRDTENETEIENKQNVQKPESPK